MLELLKKANFCVTIRLLGGVFCAVLFVSLLAFSGCFKADNPFVAGNPQGGAISIAHDQRLSNVGHAQGYCQPLTNCSACHGSELRGGAGGQPSCFTCHDALWLTCGNNPSHNIPLGGVNHVPGFCQPLTNCTRCHGASLKGGGHSEPSCTTCHGQLWTGSSCGQNIHTVNLGGHFHAEGYCRPYQDCSACHGPQLHGGGHGEPSCLECHDQRQWMNCRSTQHNVSIGGVSHVFGYCQPLKNCIFCHGNNLQGGANHEPACTRCHGQLWTSSSCGQNLHTVNLGGRYHAQGYCRPYQNCTTCHGPQLHGGVHGEPSCLKCHDQRRWMNCGATQHSDRKDGVPHVPGYCQPLQNCSFCHGNRLQGGANHEPSCTRCHGQLWSGGCGD